MRAKTAPARRRESGERPPDRTENDDDREDIYGS
jgi:hypothetical protein